MAVLIEASDLHKRFGEIVAVDGISLQVQQGEVLGFLGPNGAGKSTTMKMLTGFLEPDAGSARIAGIDVFENPKAAKAKLGYLPEDTTDFIFAVVCEINVNVGKFVEGHPLLVEEATKIQIETNGTHAADAQAVADERISRAATRNPVDVSLLAFLISERLLHSEFSTPPEFRASNSVVYESFR
jgi:ABC-type Na+ transport system ATPase subunit NatA